MVEPNRRKGLFHTEKAAPEETFPISDTALFETKGFLILSPEEHLVKKLEEEICRLLPLPMQQLKLGYQK